MLSHNYLTEILDYSPWTGDWYWKVDRCRNKVKGKKAGSLKQTGYIEIRIDNKGYRAHVLAWFYMFEEWPNELDHEDTIKSNNRFYNLREATPSQNNANKNISIVNTTGYKGVSWDTRLSKYKGKIKKDNIAYHLGYSNDPVVLAKKYDSKAIELFGKFARLNFKGEDE